MDQRGRRTARVRTRDAAASRSTMLLGCEHAVCPSPRRGLRAARVKMPNVLIADSEAREIAETMKKHPVVTV